jgi:hypothetical protein
MSTKYPGGFITKSPVAPTSSAASGIWTLDQQQQAQKAGTWPSPPIFIEDLFSTYLYTGNGSTQTITNGIDLSGQGGLVWIKWRNTTYGSVDHNLYDTSRGVLNRILSNTTDAQVTQASSLTAFNSTGFSLGGTSGTNGNNANYVSWTFREQPKFFDVVTYTGTGSARTVAHNLGSVPGCIIVKRTDTSGFDWPVYHRSTGNTQRLLLNDTVPAAASSGFWNDTTPTSTVFTVGSNVNTNASGGTYVAYLFAHDAGGFPVSGGGSTNGISCGSWTGTGSTFTVNLGYEPQWLMFKRTDDVGDWIIIDNMRGVTVDGADAYLRPNTSGAESNITGGATLNSTGFSWATGAGSTFIYIAIRRGPMKTPTTGTSVFDPEAYSGDNSNTRVITTGFPPDMVWTGDRANGSRRVGDRLRGLFTNPGPISTTSSTSDEQLSSYSLPQMSGWQTGNGTVRFENSTGVDYVLHAFRRAPGFFDVVCYTGTEVSGQTFTHNLGVVPEMMIVKSRSGTTDWTAYHSALGASARIYPNATNAANTGTAAPWNSTSPTSTVFSLGNAGATNLSGGTFVNYLFATVAGVSKVGSYTGTGALLTVNCGFTSGARFVLIKRTDSTGDWYLYDSARGITSGNDPYLLINSSSAETTGTNYVDTDTTGFQVTAAAPAGLNANGGTYIFLAIA